MIVALAAAAGLWLGERFFTPPPPPQLDVVALYPAPRALPDFELVQGNGQPFTQADWQGRWNLVFFGYTHCPDVCPTTLASFKQAWKLLGEAGLQERVRFDFISVDPQRDTPERLAQYVAFFSPDFVAATGDDANLGRITRALGLVYTRDPAAGDDYTVDHSAAAVLIDPRGRQAGLVRPPFDAARLVADLKRLLGSG